MSEANWYTDDGTHQVVRRVAQSVAAAGTRYDAMIALGGGGCILVEIVRSCLNIPVYAITTAY